MKSIATVMICSAALLNGCGGSSNGNPASSTDAGTGSGDDTLNVQMAGDSAAVMVDASTGDTPPSDDSPFSESGAADPGGEVGVPVAGDMASPGADPIADADLPSAADDGPEQQRPIGLDADTSALTGLWNFSRIIDGEEDLLYIDISADGVATEYDNKNDAHGSGADCYLISTSAIVSRGDDTYDIQNTSRLPGSRGFDDVLITVENDEIVFRFLGNAFDPEFGEGQTGITERFPRLASGDSAGFAACET